MAASWGLPQYVFRKGLSILLLCIFGTAAGNINSGQQHKRFPFLKVDTSQFECVDDRLQPGMKVTLFSFRGGAGMPVDGTDSEDDDEGDKTDDYDSGSDEDDVPLEELPTEGYDHSLIPPSDSETVVSHRPRDLAPDGSDDYDDISRIKRRSSPATGSTIGRGKRPKHWTKRLASQSFKVGGQLAWGAVQQTGKVAYQLVKPRHVEARELFGLWRLDQQITSNGREMASVATVELDPRRRLVTLKISDGKTVAEPYTFRKTRLNSFQTEFVAPAFLVGNSPRLYGYRGTWQRKLADKSVIKLVGKIYQVRKQWFGKEAGKYHFAQPVGTFVARRRIKLTEEEDEGLDDDEAEDDREEYEGQDDEFLETDFSDQYDEKLEDEI